jgi:hypothetical protein
MGGCAALRKIGILGLCGLCNVELFSRLKTYFGLLNSNFKLMIKSIIFEFRTTKIEEQKN